MQEMNPFSKMIAATLALSEKVVENTLQLLEEGCTIPFISRYRKEKTGNLDEVNIEAIAQANEKMKEITKRKETILKTIEEQGKLSDALKKRIEDCWDATELEDIYLPFKPKRRTRAQIAREAGLEPLAKMLLFQRERNIMQVAKKYVSDNMAKHKVPSYVEFVDSFPMNAAGKILKYKMREDAAARLKIKKVDGIVTE